MPGFNAEASLQGSRGAFRHGEFFVSRADAVIPSIPACRNCYDILERCNRNGWLPRAVCNACFYGNCYEGPS